MENSISEYFYQSNFDDPTVNFDWEYILIDNKKVKKCLVYARRKNCSLYWYS